MNLFLFLLLLSSYEEVAYLFCLTPEPFNAVVSGNVWASTMLIKEALFWLGRSFSLKLKFTEAFYVYIDMLKFMGY